MVDVVAEPGMTFDSKIPCDEVYLTSSFVCSLSVSFVSSLFVLLLTKRDVEVTSDRRFSLIQKVEKAVVSSLSY